MRVLRDEPAQTLHGVSLCLWLAHVKSDLLLKIGPAVCHCIVHMDRIPHNVGKEADCVVVEGRCVMDGHIPGLPVIAPFFHRHDFPCGAVDDFPPSGDIIMVVHFQHIRVEMVHQVDGKLALHRCVERCHDIHLLDLIRIGLGPRIVLSCCVICGVNLRVHVLQLFRIIRPVTVTDSIGSPALYQFQCLRYNINVCRYRNSSFCLLLHFFLLSLIQSFLVSFPAQSLYILLKVSIFEKRKSVNLHVAYIFRILALIRKRRPLLLKSQSKKPDAPHQPIGTSGSLFY